MGNLGRFPKGGAGGKFQESRSSSYSFIPSGMAKDKNKKLQTFKGRVREVALAAKKEKWLVKIVT